MDGVKAVVSLTISKTRPGLLRWLHPHPRKMLFPALQETTGVVGLLFESLPVHAHPLHLLLISQTLVSLQTLTKLLLL